MTKKDSVDRGGIKYERAGYKEFKPVLIKLRPSKLVKGEVGVFAARNLKRGVIVGDVDMLEDLFFTWDDYKKIDKDSREVIKDFCITSPDGFYAPQDINYMPGIYYINHCCDGNVGHDKDGNMVTIKSVEKDKELCYDYGFAGSSDPNFKFKCKCGSKKCRKIITGTEWEDWEYSKKNYKYMTPELRELVKQKFSKNKYDI
jgi:hypothetical protein